LALIVAIIYIDNQLHYLLALLNWILLKLDFI
jgi:hypothetical protein